MNACACGQAKHGGWCPANPLDARLAYARDNWHQMFGKLYGEALVEIQRMRAVVRQHTLALIPPPGGDVVSPTDFQRVRLRELVNAVWTDARDIDEELDPETADKIIDKWLEDEDG